MIAKPGVKTATPRLRFPEFRNWPAWSQKRLASISNSESSSVALNKLSLQFDGFPVYGADGIVGYIDGFAQRDRYIAIVKDGSGVGRLALLPGESTVLGTLAYIKTRDETQARLDWLFHTLSTVNFQKYVKGSGIPHIYFSDFSNEIVGVPSFEEQQKIADCLTSLDAAIGAQGRKVEALKAHKCGLMQQLFPREGETRPRLRFPEFRNAREWITRPLGELMVIGSSRRVHESDWTTAGIPFYRAREIVAIGKGEPIDPLSISEALYSEFAGFTGEIEEGQLLVTGVGSIGIPYLVKSGDRFYFKDGNIIWLKNSQNDLAGDFLLRLFESEYVQGQIATMAGIGTVGTYTIENAKRTIAAFPIDKREQQHIADCFFSLDTQIAAESNRLAALKTHKQGLMQQLFPALEAIEV